MRIAIATSPEVPNLPPGKHALLSVLGDLGIAARPLIWSSDETDWAAFDAVVIRSCWDYHLRPNAFLDWIARLEALKIPVLNPPEAIRWNIDKRYLKDLSAKGIPIPESIWILPGDRLDVAEACRERSWKCAVVKPLVGATAYRTERQRDGIVHGPMIVQEFVPAIQTSGEWSLVFIDGSFSHSVRKRARDGDFRVQQEFGGSIELAKPPDSVLAVGESAMAALPRPAVMARVDLVEAGSSVVLMELELIDPELFFQLAPEASGRLAAALRAELLRV
jgi:glutathione synthase/RimK-type ligase-like ATP-grasp enzyme